MSQGRAVCERTARSPAAPALLSRIELRLGFGLWGVLGVTALVAGAFGTFLPFAIPVVLLIASWPVVRRIRAAGWVLDWLPLIFVVFTYETLANVVPAIWVETIDPWLRDADRSVFGADLGVLLEPAVSEPLTMLMSLFYGGYYLMPFSLALWWYTRDRRAFRELVAGEVGALFIGYLGYLFLPAVGPYAHVPEAFTTALTGDFVGDGLRELIASRGSGFPRDAFPSLHTANAVTILLVAARHDRRVLAVYALPVAGLIAATLYLRFHYAVDVLAGAALAILWQQFVPRLVAPEGFKAPGGAGLQSPPPAQTPMRKETP